MFDGKCVVNALGGGFYGEPRRGAGQGPEQVAKGAGVPAPKAHALGTFLPAILPCPWAAQPVLAQPLLTDPRTAPALGSRARFRALGALALEPAVRLVTQCLHHRRVALLHLIVNVIHLPRV